MKPNSIRVGIIGCGQIAGSHVEGYLANGVSPVACFDSNVKMMEVMGEKISGCRCFSDYCSMLDSGEVNVISICTPPLFHEEVAVYALEKGVHVLCEKPLAHDVTSAQRMVKASRRGGSFLMTAFRHRHLPAICKIKSLIQSGEIGRPVFFQNTFCGPAFYMKDKWFSQKKIAGGGCLMDTSSHSVDLFRFLIGEVVTQQAVVSQHLEGTDVEDVGVLSLKSSEGVLGTLISSWVAGLGMATIQVMGEGGFLEYDYAHQERIRLFKIGMTECQNISVEKSNGFKEEIAHWIRVVCGKESLSGSGEDGLRAVEIIQNSYQSSFLRIG